MKQLSLEQFTDLVVTATVKPRLRRELRFIAAVQTLTSEQWSDTELLAISDRTGKKGVLILQPDDTPHVVAFELTSGIASASTGRAQPVICDFCRTWQRGSNAASITLTPDYRSGASTTFLCCADLGCSRHVRSLTSAAKLSRAQLRENLDDSGRIERLARRLRDLITQLKI